MIDPALDTLVTSFLDRLGGTGPALALLAAGLLAVFGVFSARRSHARQREAAVTAEMRFAELLRAQTEMQGIKVAVMQFQADQLGVDVVRPEVAETTALGAAYAAGIAVGFWSGESDVVANWVEGNRWSPSMADEERERMYRQWKKAVTKTFDWVDTDTQ